MIEGLLVVYLIELALLCLIKERTIAACYTTKSRLAMLQDGYLNTWFNNRLVFN
jgi:hypothetical protein